MGKLPDGWPEADVLCQASVRGHRRVDAAAKRNHHNRLLHLGFPGLDLLRLVCYLWLFGYLVLVPGLRLGFVIL
jgi:hypothetical protein